MDEIKEEIIELIKNVNNCEKLLLIRRFIKRLIS